MKAVRDHGEPLVDDPARTADVKALGVDETSFLVASYARQLRTQFVTGLVDLDCGGLLDIVPGRAGSVVTAWLSGRDVAAGTDALPPRLGPARQVVAGSKHAVPVIHVVGGDFDLVARQFKLIVAVTLCRQSDGGSVVRS